MRPFPELLSALKDSDVDIVVSDRVRLGLNYRHDFIFTDANTTEMDRVYAGLKFLF